MGWVRNSIAISSWRISIHDKKRPPTQIFERGWSSVNLEELTKESEYRGKMKEFEKERRDFLKMFAIDGGF